MNSQDMISVIVPVYNVETYLDKCIRSIVDQSYANLEIILVDDGSSDRSSTICDVWGTKDDRIKVIHQKNGGLSDARNTGMSAATGDYISFIDSDDWIAPEMMARLIEAIRQDKSDIAACTVQIVSEKDSMGELLTAQKNMVLDQVAAQKSLLEDSLLRQPVWYKLYKRVLIQDIPFETGKYHEDVFWSYQAVGKANKISLIDYIGYYYRQRTDSIMGKEYSLTRLDALEAVEKRYHFLAEHCPELERNARISILVQCIYNAQMSLKYLSGENKKRAFRRLNSVKNRYSYPWRDYCDQKWTHRLWMDIGRCSLVVVGMVKNMLGVGI